MGTTANKLQAILDSKAAIKTAINNKGGTLTDSTPLDEYATAINNLTGDQLPSFLGDTLTSVSTGVYPITQYAFAYRTSLEYVELPNILNVTAGCFSNCTSLTDVVLSREYGTNLDNINAFDNIPHKVTIHVPAILVSTYKVTTNWLVLYNNDLIDFVAIQ